MFVKLDNIANFEMTLRPKHLHRDPARLGLVEGPRYGAVQRRPGFGIDLGSERGLERRVRIVGPQEVGVAHEERFLVVIGIEELGRAGSEVGSGNDQSLVGDQEVCRHRR